MHMTLNINSQKFLNYPANVSVDNCSLAWEYALFIETAWVLRVLTSATSDLCQRPAESGFLQQLLT